MFLGVSAIWGASYLQIKIALGRGRSERPARLFGDAAEESGGHVTVYALEQGKIVRVDEYPERAVAMEALGAAG
jgi:hypothetical protein